MTKKINSYANKTLVISVAAAALGVVALTTQNVKADQVADPAVKTAPNKQPATKIVPAGDNTNLGTTTDTLEQANNADNEDKPNQPPAAKAPSLPPKKAIKTVADLPKTITWKDTNDNDSDINLTLNADDQGGYELDISGGEIKDPHSLQNVFSANDDYQKIHTINIKKDLTISGDAQSLFESLESLNQIEGLDKLDTSKVTNMSYMFSKCYNLSSLDVSKFATSKVTNMSSMFSGCGALTSLDVSHFDTSKVTDMSYMFNGCGALTSLDVSKFNTSKVTNMSYMFGNCSVLTTLDLSKFDTSQVKNMSGMFGYCSALTSLDLSSFDTSQVTDMSYMFWYCSALSSLDVSSFDTSQVTSMNQMFSKCDVLTRLDLSNFKTSKVTDMSAMFMYDPKLTYLDISNFDTKNLSSMACFGIDDQLNTLRLGDNFVTKFPHEGDYSYMGLPGPTWHKVGNGTLTRPEDKNGQPVAYFDNFDGSDHFNDSKGKKADTYVRLNLADSTSTIAGNITINYFDQDGNKINLPESSKLSQPCQGLLGGIITITPQPEITDTNGKHYTLTDSGDPQVITFTADPQTIKLHYKAKDSKDDKVAGGAITVYYYDKAGKELKHETHQGAVGVPLTPQADIEVNGIKYHLIENDSRNSKNVTFTEQPQDNIKFYYEKVSTNTPNTGSNNSNILGGDVTVHYQDEEGHSLAPDEIIKGHLGAGYVSRTLQISGYSLKTRPEQATGFFTSDPQSITYVYTLDEAKISKRLMHNAFIYDLHHQRVGKHKFYSYERIMVYPKLVHLTDGVRAYKLADNQYVLAANIDGTLRKLKHSAYIYQTGKKRANRLVLRKGKVIRTYGAPYQFKNGKLYYRIGGPKKQYVKVSNFK